MQSPLQTTKDRVEFLLGGKRLSVRPWRKADVNHYMKLALDVGYNCFSPPGHFLFQNPDQASIKVNQRIQQFKESGLGKFPIFLNNSDEFIGTCGLEKYSLGGGEEIELGYRLCLQHWGKGYATEAAQLILSYGFNVLNLKKIIAFAVPQNRSSLKVIEKLGFEKVGEISHAGLPHILYETSDSKSRTGQELL
jgi:ribosomal-protein-alanine N-acetyltransferase